MSKVAAHGDQGTCTMAAQDPGQAGSSPSAEQKEQRSLSAGPAGRRTRSDEQRGIERLLGERIRIAVPLSTVFLLFSVLDWIMFPQHAGRWLVYRIATLALVFLMDWLTAISSERRGFSLAVLYALAFSSAMSVMTYESGGFASPYYVGLMVLLAAIFVLFPLDYRRGLFILAIVLIPYVALGVLHGEIDPPRAIGNLTFLLSTGAFLVLGGHLSTRLLVGQIQSKARLQALISELEDNSRRDPLTQLFNRRHLNDHLATVLPADAGDPPLCFAIADIDDFKQVNDAYGHQAGDYVLAQVARQLCASIRTNDLVFRYGGEEFAIVLPSTDMADARRAAERIRATVDEREFSWQGRRLSLSLSIGVTTVIPGESPEAVIRRADEALYHAKRDGRNQVVSAA